MPADPLPSVYTSPLTNHNLRLLPKAVVPLLLTLAVVLIPPISDQPATGQPPVGDPAAGQPGPAKPPAKAQPADRAAIDRAIALGVDFLRRTQTASGTWGEGSGKEVGSAGGWAVGYTALAGLALVECGTPTSDPGLRNALRVVRAGYPKLDATYEVALAILFLDRMGEKVDHGRIQSLAARLIAGQTATGGWGYKVPIVGDAETLQILGSLRKLNTTRPSSTGTTTSFRDRPGAFGLCIKMSDDIRPKPSATVVEVADPEKLRASVVATLPAGARRLPVFQSQDRLVLEDPADGKSDNSNTHFATIGLWASRRHDVPTDRSFALLARRFRTSQTPEGLWGYAYKEGGAPAMTCVALLGLAIGHALAVDPDAGARADQDPAILLALKAISNRVGEPVGRTDNRPTPKDIGGLYYMWALERIAVLYDISKIGNKDWYLWGAEILLCHQKPDGSWTDGGFHGDHPALNTAFALLFLKRANLTPDLSKRLIVDSAALTTKVDDPPPPKPEPEPPPPKSPEIKLPSIFDPPSPKVEEPPPTVPPPTTPAPKASEPAASTPEPEPKPIWPWIAGLVVVLLGGGAVLFFALRGKKDDDDGDDEAEDDDGEEKPKKKKGAKNSGAPKKPRKK